MRYRNMTIIIVIIIIKIKKALGGDANTALAVVRRSQ